MQADFTPRLTQLIDTLIQHEGAYPDDPDDRGGPAKYGIRAASAADGGTFRCWSL